jgi:hypothetical protein
MKLWKLPHAVISGVVIKKPCVHDNKHMLFVTDTWVHWCSDCGALKIQPPNAKDGWSKGTTWKLPSAEKAARKKYKK